MSCAKSIACLGGMKLKNFVSFHSKLLRLVYEYIVPEFQSKTSSFRLPYERPSSGAGHRFWFACRNRLNQ